jgi:hypothetical protein
MVVGGRSNDALFQGPFESDSGIQPAKARALGDAGGIAVVGV